MALADTKVPINTKVQWISLHSSGVIFLESCGDA